MSIHASCLWNWAAGFRDSDLIALMTARLTPCILLFCLGHLRPCAAWRDVDMSQRHKWRCSRFGGSRLHAQKLQFLTELSRHTRSTKRDSSASFGDMQRPSAFESHKPKPLDPQAQDTGRSLGWHQTPTWAQTVFRERLSTRIFTGL